MQRLVGPPELELVGLREVELEELSVLGQVQETERLLGQVQETERLLVTQLALEFRRSLPVTESLPVLEFRHSLPVPECRCRRREDCLKDCRYHLE